MRKVILSMQISLDGYVEGPPGNEMNWVETEGNEIWTDLFRILQSVDTMITGRKMAEGYYDYWHNALTDPSASKEHVEYARLAEKTPHHIFSKTWDRVKWKNARVVNGPVEEEMARLKQQPGKDIMVWGGASMATAFINHNLVDVYRFVINPVLLGGGKNLFVNSSLLNRLKLVESKTIKSGAVILMYEKAGV